MTKASKINFLVNAAFYTIVALILYFTFRFLFIYLFPFLIGLFITIAVQKPATVLSKRIKTRKGYCALFLVILFYLLLVGLVALVVFLAGRYLSGAAIWQKDFIGHITDLLTAYTADIEEIIKKLPESIEKQLSTGFNSLINGITAYISDLAAKTAKAAPMFFTSTVVTVIASCYIAKDFERFQDSIYSVFPQKFQEAIGQINILIKEKILKIIVGYGKILVITFLELSIGLLLFKVPNAVLIASGIALLDLLPVLGTGTVLVPWAVVSLLSSKVYLGIGLIIIYVIIIVVRNIIEPKIIGKQIGLHPLIALISVFIGLKVVGVIGIFLAPLTVILIYNMFERGIFDILLSKNE